MGGFHTVTLPDGRSVDFPSSMGDQEINAAVRKIAGGPQVPSQPDPAQAEVFARHARGTKPELTMWASQHPQEAEESRQGINRGAWEAVGGLAQGAVDTGKKILFPQGATEGARLKDIWGSLVTDPLKVEQQKAQQTTGLESMGHSVASYLPVLGPMAAQAGEALGRKDYGGAAVLGGAALAGTHGAEKAGTPEDLSAKISDAQKAIHRHLAIDQGKVRVVNENVRQTLALLDNAVNGEIGKSVNSVLTADDADRLSSGLKGGSVDVSKASGAARDMIGKTAKNVSNAADDQILRGESQPSMTMRDAKSYTTDVGNMAAALRRQGNFREAAVLDSLYNGLHEATQERAGQLGKVHGDLWQHYINETRNYKDMQGGLLGELVDEPNHARALDKLVDPSKATEAKEITEALKKYKIDSTPFEKAQEMGVRLNKFGQDNKTGFMGTLKGIMAHPIAVGLPVLAIKTGMRGMAGMIPALIAATKISGILNDVELSRTLREIGETTSPESARVRPPLEGEVPKPPPPTTGGPQAPKGGTPAPKGPDFSTDIQGMLKDQFKYTDNAAKGITNKIAGKYTTLDEGIKMAIAEATSRAKESKAPAAESPQAQWKGGISSAGTEQAIKKSSLADQIQALRSESEGLKEDIRAGRRPPGAEARIVENLQLIKELEGKK